MAKEKAEEKKKPKNDNVIFSRRRSLKALENRNRDFKVSTGSLKMDIFLDGGYRSGIIRAGAPREMGKTAMGLAYAKNWLDHWGKLGVRAEIHHIDAEGRITAAKVKSSKIDKSPYFKSDGSDDDTFIPIVWNVYEDIGTYIYDKIMENEARDEDKRYRLFFLIDSLDMLIAREGLEKSFDDAAKVAAAQTISTLLVKKLAPFLEDSGNVLYIISQIRANLNMSNPNSPKTKISGGFALEHQASMIVEMEKAGSHSFIYAKDSGDEKGDVIGNNTVMKFSKTPNEKSNRKITVPIKYGHGVWVEREIVELALQYELIKKKGAWFDIAEGFASDIEVEMSDKLTKAAIEVAKKAAEEKGEKENLSKKERAKLIEDAEKSVTPIKYVVEKKWQGLNTVFKYLEGDEELTNFLYQKFRDTLIISGSIMDEDEVVMEG